MSTSTRLTQTLPVKAKPHKRFFIDMITRDIPLEACILDLIDNAVDGATRQTHETPSSRRTRTPKPHPMGSGDEKYKPYRIDIRFTKNEFTIADNCGGIATEIAREYAFNFGRDPEQKDDSATESGIGIYGIGMKRALFKIGKRFKIDSRTAEGAFNMDIDVEAWAREGEWDMNLTTRAPSAKDPGTKIEVQHLHPGVAAEFGSTAFETKLHRLAARTFAAFLDQGLQLHINRAKVRPTKFAFLQSKQFQPLHEHHSHRALFPIRSDVDIDIWAGAAATTSDRPGAEEDDDASLWGWYVLCNNRVVLAADKTERTGWGLNKFPQWHPQYNGFIGIVAFRSEQPYALPWTTTKSDIDADSTVYRAARVWMQNAARQYTRYSRARKANLETAKELERKAEPLPATKVSKPQDMRFPTIPGTSDGEINIQYQKPKRQVVKAAQALGDSNMAAYKVGLLTFEYYYRNKVES